MEYFTGSEFKKIKKQFRNHVYTNSNQDLTILIGPSFAIWNPSALTDFILNKSLTAKGVNVIPFYCDGIQEKECNVFGGEWGGGKKFKKNCRTCQHKSKKLWEHNSNTLKFSKFIDRGIWKKYYKELMNLNQTDLISYGKESINFGRLASNIIKNNFLVESLTPIDNITEQLRVHITNLLVVNEVYKNILDDVKPDRVISNDSFYGMWKILEIQSKRREIPFYSHWPVTKNRTVFGFNSTGFNFDFQEIWQDFSKIELTSQEDDEVDSWLQGKRNYVLNLKPHLNKKDTELSQINLDKPTIVLLPNVVWDLAALDKGIIFSSIKDWILKTINYFSQYEDFQLILKPHPVEANSLLPNSKEKMSDLLNELNLHRTSNLIFLNPDSSIDLIELVALIKKCVAVVHTSTGGLDCAANGIPVITVAKAPYRDYGFTFDPDNENDYFTKIEDLLMKDCDYDKQTKIGLARKFIKLQYFHYYMDLGLTEEHMSKVVDEIKSGGVSPSAPLGYVVERIINGEPLFSSQRMMKKS